MPTELQPVVFSLVLLPVLSDDMEARLCRPEHAGGWSAMAASLRAPAAARPRGYVEQCHQAD